MSDRSSIEWTDATWNPVRGCVKVSPGCKHCYAETFAERFRGVAGHAYEQGFDPRLAPEMLAVPLRWTQPRRVFVNSMSDLFGDFVPTEYIAAVFGIMAASERHTYQVLTKRAERITKFFAWLKSFPDIRGLLPARKCMAEAIFALDRERVYLHEPPLGVEGGWQIAEGAGLVWPLPNVLLGVSVEDRRYGVPRIAELQRARSRWPTLRTFLSIEPLLEHIGRLDLTGIDWVIVGGESGPGARPLEVGWVASIVEQCKEAGVPVFVKQLGANVLTRNDDNFTVDEDPPDPDFPGWPLDLEAGNRIEWEKSERYQGALVRVRLRDRKGGEPSEWRSDLRVRELPP